ncbi:hypothetical protein [Nitrobacter sp. TKz-YC02]|uniref:hypothetical protein n=1 Tax=Nitrobacter sp. TKz-YC02 TaxID=3398704 RepID=UPI003CF9AC9E
MRADRIVQQLSDLNPELEQFTMDTLRPPKRIFDTHLPDQRAQLRLDLRSPSKWTRSPPPIAAKAACTTNNQLIVEAPRSQLQAATST